MKNILTGLIVVLTIFPAVTFASFDTNLKYGNSGIQVQALQDLLVTENCLTTSPTGYFGLLTLSGVKCFQEKYDIAPVSGYFGQLSRVKANELVSVATSDSEAAELKETGSVTMADCNPGDLFSQVTGRACNQTASSTVNIEKTIKDIQTTLQKQQSDIDTVKANTTVKASAPNVSTSPVSNQSVVAKNPLRSSASASNKQIRLSISNINTSASVDITIENKTPSSDGSIPQLINTETNGTDAFYTYSSNPGQFFYITIKNGSQTNEVGIGTPVNDVDLLSS